MVHFAEQKLRGEVPDSDAIKAILQPFTEPHVDQPNIDTVILACTHFPLLIEELKPQMPSHVRWIDSGPAIARRVSSLVNTQSKEQKKQSVKKTHRAIMTSDDQRRDALNQATKRFGLEPFEILAI